MSILDEDEISDEEREVKAMISEYDEILELGEGDICSDLSHGIHDILNERLNVFKVPYYCPKALSNVIALCAGYDTEMSLLILYTIIEKCPRRLGIFKKRTLTSKDLHNFSANMLGSYPLVEYDDVMRAYYVTRLNNMKLSDGTNRLNIRAVWRRAYFKSGNPLSKAAKFNIALLFLVFVGVTFYFSMELNHHMMYEKAMEFYNESDYDEAFIIFSELNSYKKSDFMVEKCVEGMRISDNYAAAKRLYNDGDYTAAIAIFNSMGSYKDSHQLKLECSRIISEKYDKVYLEAESLYNSGKYAKALTLYDVLFGYKDSHVKSMRCKFFLSE